MAERKEKTSKNAIHPKEAGSEGTIETIDYSMEYPPPPPPTQKGGTDEYMMDTPQVSDAEIDQALFGKDDNEDPDDQVIVDISDADEVDETPVSQLKLFDDDDNAQDGKDSTPAEEEEDEETPGNRRAKKWKMDAKTGERKDKRQSANPYSLIQRECLIKKFNIFEDLENAFEEFKFEIMKIRENEGYSDYTFVAI